jgi:hypothetical protein
LLDQTLKPERIFLCVPAEYHRKFSGFAEVPSSLSRYGERLAIVRCRKDHGPGTKLVGALDFVPRHANSLLVLADDDVVYQNYMLEVFADTYLMHRAAGSFYVRRYKGIDVGYGSNGFAIPTTCLDGVRSFYRKIQNNQHVLLVDDLWISFYLHLCGIPIMNLANYTRGRGHIYRVYNDAHPLSRERGAFSRSKCMSEARAFLASIQAADPAGN